MSFTQSQLNFYAGVDDSVEAAQNPFVSIGGAPNLAFPLPNLNRADPYPFDSYQLLRTSYSLPIARPPEYGCGYLYVTPDPAESLSGTVFFSPTVGKIPTVGGVLSFSGPVGTSVTIWGFTGGLPYRETWSTPFSTIPLDVGSHWAAFVLSNGDLGDRSGDVHLFCAGEYIGVSYAGITPLGLPDRYRYLSTLFEYSIGDTDNDTISSPDILTPPTLAIGSLSPYTRYRYLRGDGGGIGADSNAFLLGLITNGAPLVRRPFAIKKTYPPGFPDVLTQHSTSVAGVPS